jgi:hypothetical protein
MSEKFSVKSKIFQVFKVSTCGNQVRRDYVTGLTLEEVRDETRFPLGLQSDATGKFVWSYAVDPASRSSF